MENPILVALNYFLPPFPAGGSVQSRPTCAMLADIKKGGNKPAAGRVADGWAGVAGGRKRTGRTLAYFRGKGEREEEKMSGGQEGESLMV